MCLVKFAEITAPENIMEFMLATDALDSSSDLFAEIDSTFVNHKSPVYVLLIKLIEINAVLVAFKDVSMLV